MKNLYKSMITLLLSLSFVFLSYIACNKIDSYTEQQMNIIFYAPYIILLLATVLAWKFNRSRSFFIMIIFLATLFTTYYRDKFGLNPKTLHSIHCILLPFNVLIFTFLKERGILSFWGIFRFGFIIVQAGLIYWLLTPQQHELFQNINKYLVPIEQLPILSLSYIAFILFLISFIVLIIRIILYQSSQDLSFFSIMIALLYMLNVNRPFEYSIFFSAIGIIAILSILKDTYFMAFYDELTNLPSRRALNQDLMKLGMKYSIAMVDIDFFKKFNDTHGHDTGDEVLKFVASMIKEVKGGGKAYRYGGEEFTILFPGKSPNEAFTFLDELRETIAKRGFVIRHKRRAKGNTKNRSNCKAKKRNSKTKKHKKVFIHVSIGVAGKDDTLKTTAMVIKAADTALYRAKKRGRNCVSK